MAELSLRQQIAHELWYKNTRSKYQWEYLISTRKKVWIHVEPLVALTGVPIVTTTVSSGSSKVSLLIVTVILAVEEPAGIASDSELGATV